MTFSAPPGRSGRQAGIIPGLQPIATRTGINGGSGYASLAPYTAAFYRMRHLLPYGTIGDVTLLEAGFYLNSVVETSTIAPLTAVQGVASIMASGGTAYAVGDAVTMPTSGTDGRAATGRVLAVSSGAPTKMTVYDRGAYITAQTDGVSQASTTGNGTGATFAFTWQHLGVQYMRAGIEPIYGTQATLVSAQKGSLPGGTACREIIIQGGEIATTDPMQMIVAPGGAIATRRYFSGGVLAQHRTVMTGEYGYLNAAASDQSISGTVSGTSPGASMNQPFAIIGRLATPKPWFLIVGDSIVWGSASGTYTTDPGDSNFNVGWVERGIGSAAPYVSVARGGDKYNSWTPSTAGTLGAFMRWSAMAKLDFSRCIVIDEMALNDITGGGTSTGAADLFTNKKTIWAALMGHGAQEIWTTTMTPQASSTDAYVTVANQTAGARTGTQGQIFNANIRAQSAAGTLRQYGVTQTIDTAAAIEDGGVGAPTGRWNVGVMNGAPAGSTNWTGDGAHPQAFVHQYVLAPLLAPLVAAATLRSAEINP